MSKPTSDDLVAFLQPYGVVRIHQCQDKKFHASLKLFMHGMTSEVKTDFNRLSMLDALIDLTARVGKVLELSKTNQSGADKRKPCSPVQHCGVP